MRNKTLEIIEIIVTILFGLMVLGVMWADYL